MTCPAFAALVLYWATEFAVPPQVVHAQLVAESTCRPQVVNKVTGAVGLGQILPGTRAALGYPRYRLFDPGLNIALTVAHLRRCFDLCGTWRGARRVYGGKVWCSR